MSESDLINNPPHYNAGSIQVIDFVEDQALGYHLGQVVDYVCRAGRKEGSDFVDDLKKARWFLDRKIMITEKLRQP